MYDSLCLSAKQRRPGFGKDSHLCTVEVAGGGHLGTGGGVSSGV